MLCTYVGAGFAGGPKLRKWYGAPDLLPKDGSLKEDEAEDDYPGNLRSYGRLCLEFYIV